MLAAEKTDQFFNLMRVVSFSAGQIAGVAESGQRRDRQTDFQETDPAIIFRWRSTWDSAA